MQYLYQSDLLGADQVEPLEAFLSRQTNGDPVIDPFARAIIAGVQQRRNELDEKIKAAAQNWRMERMAIVDRNILRICAWELLHGEDVPASVAINEAIDLAKRFSSEDSGPFVNGILDRIKETVP